MFQIEEANVALVALVKPLKPLHQDNAIETKEEEETKEDGVEDSDESGGDAHQHVLEHHEVSHCVEQSPKVHWEGERRGEKGRGKGVCVCV